MQISVLDYISIIKTVYWYNLSELCVEYSIIYFPDKLFILAQLLQECKYFFDIKLFCLKIILIRWQMVLSIIIIQILQFWLDIKDFIHICAVIRFTAQIEISNPQIIFIIHMSVLWQVKSINYQTIHKLSHIDPNCIINQELKNV